MAALQRVVAALAAATVCRMAHADGSPNNVASVPLDQAFDGIRGASGSSISSSSSNQHGFNFTKWAERRGPSREEREEERIARSKRMKERAERAKERLQSVNPDPSTLERMTKEQVEKMNNDEQDEDEHSWLRRAGWSWGANGISGDYQPYDLNNMMDPSQEYDKWAQAYRMLGGYIDCDNSKSEEGSHDSGDNNDNDDGGNQACSRWMIWASYVNPNYQGNEYYEYFGDDPTGVLDCHHPDSDWELLGIYRQEFYQYIEQISKHLWAVDAYEYIVALAGLAYMTDYDCFYVGASDSGDSIYAGVVPEAGGKFRMGLYTDTYCIYENTDLGKTFDDFGLTSDVSLGSGDNNGGYYYDEEVYEWWQGAQEYTLESLNEVYDTFRYCTSCVDYPTYQDGYFIGDYGTDDDDLINQCWKFWSHDSFVCNGDCITKAHSQGTILSVTYGGVTWGETPGAFYSSSSATTGTHESRWSRLASNIFLTASFMVFIATFLAFAVARRSRNRERKSSKHRRLLGDDRHSRRRRRRKESGDGVFRSSKSHRSSRREEEGDGVYRASPRSRRNSGDGRRKSRSKSSSRRKEGGDDSGVYQPPSMPDSEERRRGSSRSHKPSSSSSARRDDEF